MMTNHPQRGVTLLIAVILSSVIVSVALALLDISYKQQLLASTAKQSQYAFYAADSVMECALYWDQQWNAFDYTSPIGSISCNNQTITPSSVVTTNRVTTFTLPCATGGIQGIVTVTKSSAAATNIFATGYSTCNASDPRRIERGLKVNY
ncbi:MAG: hypothetical protein AAB472_00795 [Patescibacteria group bacterium]